MSILTNRLATVSFLATVVCSSVAHASATFGQVEVCLYNTVSGCAHETDPSPLPVTVVDGEADAARIHSYVVVNIDPTSISVRFDPPSQQGFGDIGDFNGLMLWGIDWHGEPSPLEFDIETNMSEELCNICLPYGQRIAVSGAFVGFDWRRYLFTSDSYFNVQVRSVPEPGSGSVALFALALCGPLLPRSRRKG